MISKIKALILIAILISVPIVLMGTGLIPGLGILGTEGHTTQKKWYNNYHGNHYGELLLPADRKGFITSYREDLEFGYSETIVVAGNYKAQAGFSQVKCLKYIIKYKESPISGWEVISKPGSGNTVTWLTTENPGIIDPVVAYSERRDLQPYVFNIKGKREGAIRAELWGYFDPNEFNPFDVLEWKLLSSDQAVLLSGKCVLFAPMKSDGTYQTTFEIGETVNIKVETGVGAPEIDIDAREGEKTWELHLIKPDGTEYTDQNFPRKLSDHYQGTVSFKVYDNMWNPGGNNRWKLQLYNTIWKKGTLEVSMIDFKAKMPSKPLIEPDCGLSILVPDTVTVKLTASPNPDTQLAVQSYGVMVWYGKGTNLAPGSWDDDRWILRQTTISASFFGGLYIGSFSFDVNKPNRYVTIIAYTHDIGGRDSDTEFYQIKTYGSGDEEPDEQDLIDEGGGQWSYGGGSSGEDIPSDYFKDVKNWIETNKIIIAITVFFIFLVIGIQSWIEIPGDQYGRILIVVLGIVLAAAIYLFL